MALPEFAWLSAKKQSFTVRFEWVNKAPPTSLSAVLSANKHLSSVKVPSFEMAPPLFCSLPSTKSMFLINTVFP